MINRKLIDYEIGSHQVLIERGHLQFFNRVIGQNNPVYLDEDAAKAAGYPGLPVPPTFWFSLDLERENPNSWFNIVGFDFRRLLHGMQDFTYHKPAFAGQTVTLNSKITDMFEKKDGQLEFVLKGTSVTDEAGELLVTFTTTYIMRNTTERGR